MSSAERAVALLERQQSEVQVRSPQWMVGEQLKDICRHEPQCAELIAQDIENPKMSITEAEKKLKDFADNHKHKAGTFFCVSPEESDRILREFYGLPNPNGEEETQSSGAKVLNLADFLR